MAVTSYLLKLEEEEKERWREYAQEHYNNNLARMIRVAVSQMIDRGHDNTEGVSFDDTQLMSAIEQTKTELQSQLNRIEDLVNQHPKLPLGLYLKAKEASEKEQQERGLKHDF